ncbi:Protein of unknown function [Nitrosomonas cryotolerans]|uniref:DUF3617 domain-containing protein n=1 Tax=Nitrosomonas cryotolerans ATCC 49181 TaxID=1131553 RepID=A0A1N6HTH3_9PROT|nr:DUF3617 domain-containing protein [Nitrosomonas cryotolerans]SFP86963.1 Protein of unknown function [Nitrosomonas cryotolerans]SIO23020.1 Protein of unknown function [Nitrosomonas cryotolerans ATCC 49181]
MCKILFLISLLMIATTSMATNNIRPGLWEVTTTSELLAMVPHIPSQQMQQITHLIEQYGLQMPRIQNGAAISKVCITQEMAAQEVPAHFYENQSGCAVKNATRAGNDYKVELVCTNAQFQGTGVAEGTFTSPERFTGQTEFDSVVQGTPVFTTAETSARWINESCTLAR